MVIDMLTGVSEMLGSSKDIEVKCAKIMLDKIIKGMGKSDTDDSNPFANQLKPIPRLSRETGVPKLPLDRGTAAEPVYEIVVDGSQRITSIKGLPLDSMVELDGVAMTHQQAIGKTFASGRVL